MVNIDLDEWMTQAQAAKLRGVSLQAINHLVRRGRFRVMRIAGRVLINRDDVINYQRDVGGRPKSATKKRQSPKKPAVKQSAGTVRRKQSGKKKL
jgi:excisionase family DNA binding protein